MSNNAKAQKSKQPVRDKKIQILAAKLGQLTGEMYQAHRRYVIAHNDKLCGARTPTDSDKRDVLATRRRWDILCSRCKNAETSLRKFISVPDMMADPRKSLG